MGLISWLFSKNPEKNSYVRRWVVKEIEKVVPGKKNVFALFVDLIDTASRFGKPRVEEQDNSFQEVAKQYLGDTTIFEIACYTYYRIESWLLANERELKPKVADPIAFWIIEIFSVAWGKDEKSVGQLFGERLDTYRSIESQGNSAEKVISALEQRILNTKGDQFSTENVQPDDSNRVLDYQFIKQSLEIYETTYLPAIIEATQAFCCKQLKQQLLSTEKNLGSEGQAVQENKDYLFAMALMKQKDFVKACKAFTKVLNLNPENFDARLERGRLYAALGEPANALEDFSKAIALNPSDSRPYLHRGKFYHLSLGQGDNSLADYSKAISLAPDLATAYFGRGALYDDIALTMEKQALENNEPDKYAQVSEEFLAAIKDYSQGIALDPEYEEAYLKRGLAYARKARVNKSRDFAEKAIADLEKAMSLNWENGYLYKTSDEMKELLERDHPE